MDLVEYCCDIS